MAYKMGLLLSLSFLMAVLLLMADLSLLFGVRSSLDALALTISYRIAYEGRLTTQSRELVASYGAKVVMETKNALRIGDLAVFRLEKTYEPLLIAKDPITVTVRRSTVVGYYDEV